MQSRVLLSLVGGGVTVLYILLYDGSRKALENLPCIHESGEDCGDMDYGAMQDVMKVDGEILDCGKCSSGMFGHVLKCM